VKRASRINRNVKHRPPFQLYHVTSPPTYGSLVFDESTGNFTYTSFAPNDGYYAPWYDSFSWDGQSTRTGTVTVDTYVDPYILYGYTR
jgi:hypothetical protein